MLKKMTLLSASSLLALIVLSGNATAGDDHSYNGSFCKPRNALQSADFRYNFNGIQNVGNSSRWLTCPVIEDRIGGDGTITTPGVTAGTTSVWAHWTAARATDELKCHLYSNDFGGDALLQAQTSSRVGTGWLDADRSGITLDDRWGTYNMSCFLPSGGTLNMIMFGENS